MRRRSAAVVNSIGTSELDARPGELSPHLHAEIRNTQVAYLHLWVEGRERVRDQQRVAIDLKPLQRLALEQIHDAHINFARGTPEKIHLKQKKALSLIDELVNDRQQCLRPLVALERRQSTRAYRQLINGCLLRCRCFANIQPQEALFRVIDDLQQGQRCFVERAQKSLHSQLGVYVKLL